MIPNNGLASHLFGLDSQDRDRRRQGAMGDDSVEKVVELSAPLGQLREQLAKLAEEYARVKAEIDWRMVELAKLMGDQVIPLPEDATLRERVMAIFKRDPQQRLRA